MTLNAGDAMKSFDLLRSLRWPLRVGLAIAAAAFLAPATAAIVGNYEPKTVTEIFVFPENGDVIFRINVPVAGCENGYWMRQSDPGFKPALDVLLLIKSRGLSIKVWGYGDDLWPGSQVSTCRLYVLSPA
jgi:hypothetical protein